MKIARSTKKKNLSLGRALYYFAFTLLVLSKMIERSAFLLPPDYFFDFLGFLATAIFGVKFLLDKHTKKELVISLGVMALVIILRLLTGWPTVLVASVFAFLSIKNVNIKTVIRTDLTIKTIFFVLHLLIFLVDFATGFELVNDFIDVSVKGTSMSLYFMNSNSAGLVGTFIAIDLLYLKDNKRFRDFVIPTIIACLTFALTISRTPFAIYLVYLLLQFIKDGKKLTIIQKGLFPLLFIVSFMVVQFMSAGNPIYDVFNSLLSGRLSYSAYAYSTLGVNVLPNMANSDLLEQYKIIVDVFYIKCLVHYGLITAVIYYLPHLLLPVDSSNEQKRMSIIASLYLLFEVAVANVGFALPYLILADAIYNRPKKTSGEKIDG